MVPRTRLALLALLPLLWSTLGCDRLRVEREVRAHESMRDPLLISWRKTALCGQGAEGVERARTLLQRTGDEHAALRAYAAQVILCARLARVTLANSRVLPGAVDLKPDTASIEALAEAYTREADAQTRAVMMRDAHLLDFRTQHALFQKLAATQHPLPADYTIPTGVRHAPFNPIWAQLKPTQVESIRADWCEKVAPGAAKLLALKPADPREPGYIQRAEALASFIGNRCAGVSDAALAAHVQVLDAGVREAESSSRDEGAVALRRREQALAMSHPPLRALIDTLSVYGEERPEQAKAALVAVLHTPMSCAAQRVVRDTLRQATAPHEGDAEAIRARRAAFARVASAELARWSTRPEVTRCATPTPAPTTPTPEAPTPPRDETPPG